jgi:hypothetical protein
LKKEDFLAKTAKLAKVGMSEVRNLRFLLGGLGVLGVSLSDPNSYSGAPQ